MKLYLKGKSSTVSAIAEYDIKKKTFTVLEGSIVSEKISNSSKFRGAKSIEKSREGIVKNGVVMKNVCFKSASSAANFVTGNSTNGLRAWKDDKGNSFKEILIKMEKSNE